jgi:hypothetical protein
MSAKRGRPQHFTSEQQQKLLDHIAQGATTEDAARIVGVSLRTVQRQARYNEFFDRNLQLALRTPPRDPETLIQHAARTHWRAAAWLLERTDPDRYGKRPANSCSPEKLFDIMTFLIETALEETPEENRSRLYRRLRDAADKLFDLMMPDQRDRATYISDALATRPMPLSDHESLAMLRDAGDRRYRKPLMCQRVDELLGTKSSLPLPKEAAQALSSSGGEPAPEAGGEGVMSPETAFCDKIRDDKMPIDKTAA